MRARFDSNYVLWLIGMLLTLSLAAGSILIPSTNLQLYVMLIAGSFLIVLLTVIVRGLSSEGFQSWFYSAMGLVGLYFPFFLLITLSAVAIIFLSNFQSSPLKDSVQLLLASLLTSSLATVFVAWVRSPSVRIVKASDKVYLVVDRVKRHIPDPLTYEFVLLDKLCRLEVISESELRLYREEKPLPTISGCKLVKSTGTEVYVIWEGKRKQFPDDKTWQHFFPNRTPEILPADSLEGYQRSNAIYSISLLGNPLA